MKRRILLIICIVLCVPLLCSGVFGAGHYYGQWQMDAARADVLEVATLLGYEPSAHLFDSVEGRNASLVNGSRHCVTTLLYTTPLAASVFTSRLAQLPWKAVDQADSIVAWDELYMSIDLTVKGVRLQDFDDSNLEFLRKRHGTWDVRDRRMRIFYFDVSTLDFPLEHNGQPFTKNVVGIYEDRGVFPVWIFCPVAFNLEPNLVMAIHPSFQAQGCALMARSARQHRASGAV